MRERRLFGVALKMGRAAVDAVSVMADLGEELQVVEPVLTMPMAFREKMETMKTNRQDLGAIEE